MWTFKIGLELKFLHTNLKNFVFSSWLKKILQLLVHAKLSYKQC